MAELQIYADSRGRSYCRSCNGSIEWAELVTSGKWIPFDDEIVAVRTEGSSLTDRVIEYVDTSITPTHFETCPDAETWRTHR